MTEHPWAMARCIEAAGAAADRSRTQLQVCVEMPADPTLRRQGLAGASRPPFTPGYDVAGRIAALGPGATNWSIGDRVVAYTEYGGYAEAVCVAAEGLARIPDRLDDTTAVALVLNYGTAFQMLRHVAQAEPGNAIVVTGAAGGVGTAVLDVARALGVTAVGLASVAKHDIVRSFCAAPVDDRSPDVVARVRDALGGRGANAVFDGIGGGHLWRSRAMADPRGLIVLFGVAGSVERGRKRMLGLAPTVVSLAGMRLLAGPRVRLYASAAEQGKRRVRYGANVAELLGMAADGQLKPLIHKEISLGEAVEAHRELEHGSVFGKIVITPSH